jgi:hypothetical protein
MVIVFMWNTVLYRKSSTFRNNPAFATKCQDSLLISPHICEACINVRIVRPSISSADLRLRLHYYLECSGGSIKSPIQLLLPAVFLWRVGRERCKTILGNYTCHWNIITNILRFCDLAGLLRPVMRYQLRDRAKVNPSLR